MKKKEEDSGAILLRVKAKNHSRLEVDSQHELAHATTWIVRS